VPDIPYYHIDAFASEAFTGNQAAVMPLPAWPDDTLLQNIAAENNFAETAFLVVDESGAADYELRWFTPETEIRLCGHATLASGHYVLQGTAADAVTFRTRKAGILSVSRSVAGGYDMALPAIPVQPDTMPHAAAALGGKILSMHSHPDRYCLFRYHSAADVMALQPDMRALREMGDHQFIATAPGDDTDIISRVFVPGAGVDEDAVTGSAHCVLTPFWADILGRGSFTAYQASRRGGHVGCRLDGDEAILSGDCVTVVTGRFAVHPC